MRIGIIAPLRHPLRDPFAGGMEAHTAELSQQLRALGHEVSVFGPEGSDPALVGPGDELAGVAFSDRAMRDVASAPAWFLTQHHAYLSLLMRLQYEAAARFDVLHDNALHYLTLTLGRLLPLPMVATLHTPPTPWFESALLAGPQLPTHFRAVSRANADSWRDVLGDVPVIANGVDTATFVPGAGGGPPVWSGRLVPEKGADHAIRAARIAGTGLLLTGPVGEPEWFADRVAPLLGGDVAYVGHLGRRELAQLVGDASAALVSPRWDEPFGLVAAEALACGTPVAAYDRGALGEIVDSRTGRLAPADDVDALARALLVATTLDRAAARERAVTAFSAARMAGAYAELYTSLIDGREADRRGLGIPPRDRDLRGDPDPVR